MSVWICLLQTFHLNEACSVWPLVSDSPHLPRHWHRARLLWDLECPLLFVVVFAALFSRSKFWLAIPQPMDICVSTFWLLRILL